MRLNYRERTRSLGLVRSIYTAIVLLLLAGFAHAQGTVIVREIIIRGNEAISVDAIRAAMRTQPGQPVTPNLLLADEDSIRDLGFFMDVRVLSRNVSETEAEIIVEVEENPIVREVRIDGNTVVDTPRLYELITEIQPLGLVYNNRNARQIRDAIASEYAERGFFIEIDRLGPDPDSRNTLLISLIEPMVNEIRIEGLTRTRQSVIERIIKTRPGEPYSLRQWRRDVEEVYYTYWFDDIRTREEPTERPGYYDLVLEVSEARTGQISAGVALDPQSRIVGTLTYNDSNFMGMGQSLGIQLSQSTVGSGPSAELAYSNRYLDTAGTWLSASVYSKVIYNFSGTGIGPFDGPIGGSSRFDERRTGGQFTFGRTFRDTYNASLGLRFESIETLSLSSDPAVEFIQQDGELAVLQIGLDRDTRFPRSDPYEGQYASVLVEPGFSNIRRIGGNVGEFEDILGRNAFIRTTLEYRNYWKTRAIPDDAPFDTVVPVIAFRARYAHIEGTVPFFEQLFVGGTGSLRGYPNQRFWGDRAVLATVEYRYPIQNTISVIGFADYGGAWGGYGSINEFQQSSRPDLRLGYGIGVSFRSPIGPIRLDFAFNQDGGNRTHFSFGTSF